MVLAAAKYSQALVVVEERLLMVEQGIFASMIVGLHLDGLSP